MDAPAPLEAARVKSAPVIALELKVVKPTAYNLNRPRPSLVREIP